MPVSTVAAEIARVVRDHLDAGADHVALQAVGEPGIPRAGWTALAIRFIEDIARERAGDRRAAHSPPPLAPVVPVAGQVISP